MIVQYELILITCIYISLLPASIKCQPSSCHNIKPMDRVGWRWTPGCSFVLKRGFVFRSSGWSSHRAGLVASYDNQRYWRCIRTPFPKECVAQIIIYQNKQSHYNASHDNVNGGIHSEDWSMKNEGKRRWQCNSCSTSDWLGGMARAAGGKVEVRGTDT